ncbi:23S rRNA (uracil(1939)-C(5))-methyltransferase RlmD [Neisseriaceae bacterium B1]
MDILNIRAIDFEGRGVARQADGKTVFVDGALPQERVRAQVLEQKSHFDMARTTEILIASPERVSPPCPHFGDCGGCSLQHASFGAQVAYKQRVFEEQLQRIGKVFPDEILPPLYGAAWHYRHRTRLAVHTRADGSLSLGFLGKRSRRVVNIETCAVLAKPLSGCLKILRDELSRMLAKQPKARLSAVELYYSEGVAAVSLCVDKRLPGKDLAALQVALDGFSGSLSEDLRAQWQVWQQVKSAPPELIAPKNAPRLAFRLPEFDLTLPYRPADFTQVNHALNEAMVSRALRWLAVEKGEKVADLFCGLGNFTLPLARSGAQVLGIEGAASLTERVRENARKNGLMNVRFITTDLFTTTEETVKSWGKLDKLLLDPPRAGALAVVQALHAPFLPQKIVYVSCNPATFARDAAVLVGKGYRFRTAGVMNLFAQTAHVEAMGVFEL